MGRLEHSWGHLELHEVTLHGYQSGYTDLHSHQSGRGPWVPHPNLCARNLFYLYIIMSSLIPQPLLKATSPHVPHMQPSALLWSLSFKYVHMHENYMTLFRKCIREKHGAKECMLSFFIFLLNSVFCQMCAGCFIVLAALQHCIFKVDATLTLQNTRGLAQDNPAPTV